ncbi:MAG: LON peptidase substrate-binding domain-containing protein [Pseudomonadota bacterium]|uniref:LON peptidase substrate-binding domain-containing protein n=1 Tax=Caldimonas aquatica TaxID=376175 RepID=A0ABY6MR16_9BURK|nr:LON peptidase substrate-binding domain-containing protein [Schlegelella aquatica]UZD54451.1 LON peptidase substrate-binding domain-containing protein [Schlegelella aquatica]
MTAVPESTRLALFPLQSVLFPDGLLGLKVFEARYLDLISTCVRDRVPFGVVALRQGQEVRRPGERVEFEAVGCSAEVIEIDGAQPGILHARCRGVQRFNVRSSEQQPGGLWVAEVEWIEPDEAALPAEEHLACAQALAALIRTMRTKGPVPFLEPYRFEDAGWIANRWCEVLPIPLAARQKLMELPDPQVRLKLVDQFLKQKGIVQAP